MSFQAYLTNIRIKTGKTLEDFRNLAEKKRFMQNGHISTGIRGSQITDWLKAEFELTHAQAMAIYAMLKGTSS